MREIKFRAYIPSINKVCFNGKGLSLRRMWRLGETYFSDDVVWVEYTGLKDKNGKEIYEGDIVRFNDLIVPDIIAPVEWGVCLAASLGDEYTEMQGWVIRPKGYDVEPLFPFSCLEVIGNIYENKELLEEK